jgi:hypothetical protein
MKKNAHVETGRTRNALFKLDGGGRDAEYYGGESNESGEGLDHFKAGRER